MPKNLSSLAALLGLALFVPACSGSDKDDDDDTGTASGEDTSPDTGSTAGDDDDTRVTVDGDDDDDDDTTYVPYAHEGYIYCANEVNGEPVSLEVHASLADGSQSVIDMADTVHASNYYEAHTLFPTASSGGYTDFAASLVSGDGTVLQYVDGVSTTFQCAPGVHFGADFGDVMTYVIRTYDADGALWECFAAGNDPQGMIDGEYSTFGNTIGTIPGDCIVARRAD